MSNGFHSKQQSADGIHVVTKWEFSTTSDRDAYSYVSTDIGGIARVGVSAPYVFYVLTNTSPAWTELGGSSGSSVSLEKDNGSFLHLAAGPSATTTPTVDQTITIECPTNLPESRYRGLVCTGPESNASATDLNYRNQYITFANTSIIGNTSPSVGGNSSGVTSTNVVKFTASTWKYGVTNYHSVLPAIQGDDPIQNPGLPRGALLRVTFSIPLKAFGPNGEAVGITPPTSETYKLRLYVVLTNSANPVTGSDDLTSIPSGLHTVGYFYPPGNRYLKASSQRPEELHGEFTLGFTRDNVKLVTIPVCHGRQGYPSSSPDSGASFGWNWSDDQSWVERTTNNMWDGVRLVLAAEAPASPSLGYVGCQQAVFVVEHIAGL